MQTFRVFVVAPGAHPDMTAAGLDWPEAVEAVQRELERTAHMEDQPGGLVAAYAASYRLPFEGGAVLFAGYAHHIEPEA